jgi:hypothetical protein
MSPQYRQLVAAPAQRARSRQAQRGDDEENEERSLHGSSPEQWATNRVRKDVVEVEVQLDDTTVSVTREP